MEILQQLSRYEVSNQHTELWLHFKLQSKHSKVLFEYVYIPAHRWKLAIQDVRAPSAAPMRPIVHLRLEVVLPGSDQSQNERQSIRPYRTDGQAMESIAFQWLRWPERPQLLVWRQNARPADRQGCSSAQIWNFNFNARMHVRSKPSPEGKTS